MEQSEKKKIYAQNEVAEFIHRHHDDEAYRMVPPRPKAREKYPWEVDPNTPLSPAT